jgi:hypothetical protein
MLAKLGVLAALIACSIALLVGVASAGGSPWEFDRDSYEPGDRAVARAPFGTGCCNTGWLDEGPYFAWVLPRGEGGGGSAVIPADALRVGEVETSEQSYEYEGRTFSHFVASVAFSVPDLPPGPYSLLHCNDPCTKTLGDITDGFFWVGPPGDPALLTPTTAATTSTTTTPPTTTEVPPTTTLAPTSTTLASPATTTSTTTSMPLIAGGIAVAGVSGAGVRSWRRRRAQ